MSETAEVNGSYRVELSGWDLGDTFFVEKTNLLWSQGGIKKLLSRHTLPAGAIVFVRLADPAVPCSTVPVAYRVEDVQSMNCAGQCEMHLVQLYPRSKESKFDDPASYVLELKNANKTKENEKQPRHKEVLHEARID